MKRVLSIVIIIIGTLSSCAQKKINTATAELSNGSAFPGAEGFGKYATGGRGGKVMIVTNLNDNGAGSFREAAEARMPRIIVFAVSGTVHLQTKITVRSDVTIAGQSAPGDGICIADNSVLINGNNMIIRYMRFRMGDKYQKGGMVDGNGGDDAFGGTRCRNVIIDHCSMSWSTDEVFSVYAGDSTTLQWNLISEPLNYSYHFETGDKDYEHHGYGGIWGGRHLSGHHNLFVHCGNRCPRFDGARNIPEENVDYRNNVIYNWGSNNVYAGEGGNYNVVNNYYKYGPATTVRNRVVNPYKKPPSLSYGKFYVDGNYVDGEPQTTLSNWRGVVMQDGTKADTILSKVNTPFPSMDVITQSPEKAYEVVLLKAGASLHRDTLDQRLINDVKTRTGRIIDVQGGYPHGTAYEKTVNAWPTLHSSPAPKDSDADGIPDDWEKKHGLNGSDASDATKYKMSKTYTNIEVYLNSL